MTIIYETFGFRTHVGCASMQFAAADQAEADRFVATYLDQHGLVAPGTSCRPAERG